MGDAVEGEGWEVEEYTNDFRVGGREFSRFRYQAGPEIVNETIFQDIVPERRIIIAYWMTFGGQRISVSLATMEFEPAGAGTRLVFTEQGAYLDGLSGAADREEGTRALLECLDREVMRVIAEGEVLPGRGGRDDISHSHHQDRP